MKRVLLVGLSYTGPNIENVIIEKKGLGKPEICKNEAAGPLYEYNVIIINPKSYSHFIFGEEKPYSSSEKELWDLKKQNEKYDIDTVFDYEDRLKELNIAIANGSKIIWLAVEDKKQSFFGQRSLYRAYLNQEVKNIFDQSWLYQKKGKHYNILKENQFANYFKVLSSSGWEISWDSSDIKDSCFVSTPEGYCLGSELVVNDKTVWILSPPTSDASVKELINCSLLESTEAVEIPSLGQVVEITKVKVLEEMQKNETTITEVDGLNFNKDYKVNIGYISGDEVKKFVGSIKLLLVTATEIETKTLRTYLDPIQGYDKILEGTIDDITYRIGKFGEYNAVHFQCGMGTVGRDASLLSTYIAIKIWEPYIVVMVGIAFGGNPVKQQLGDVLISEMISPYESVRVGDTKIIPRGPSSVAGSVLLNHFRNMIDWEYNLPSGKKSQKIIGEILSGEKLIDNKEYKEELLRLFPNAIGGEMEGAGIYAAATRAKVPEWILVKGICDWGDGTKSKQYQPIAADAAACLCSKVFSNPHSFLDLPKSINRLPISSENAAKMDSDGGDNAVKHTRYGKEIIIRKYSSERDAHTDFIISLDYVKSPGVAIIKWTLPDGKRFEGPVSNGDTIDFDVMNKKYMALIKYINYGLDEVGVEIIEKLF